MPRNNLTVKLHLEKKLFRVRNKNELFRVRNKIEINMIFFYKIKSAQHIVNVVHKVRDVTV